MSPCAQDIDRIGGKCPGDPEEKAQPIPANQGHGTVTRSVMIHLSDYDVIGVERLFVVLRKIRSDIEVMFRDQPGIEILKVSRCLKRRERTPQMASCFAPPSKQHLIKESIRIACTEKNFFLHFV